MEYVTYNSEGILTGSYIQDLHPDHEDNFIEVSSEQRANWTTYRTNETRDGLELLPAPAPPAPVVPDRVTRRQARQALLLAGLLDSVQPAIDAIPNPTQRGLAQIEWDDSQDFERQRPLVIGIGAALGLDAAALDALFIQAATL